MNAPPASTASLAAGQAAPHESARLHVTGEATYTDDIPELAGTLHAALGLSARAHARIDRLELDAVRAAPGVVAVLTAADIPGDNNCGPVLHDDPILAGDEVRYVGQPVFAVIATSHDAARRAARLGRVAYTDLPACLDPRAAHAAGEFVVPPLHRRVGDVDAALAAAPHRLCGQWSVGGQEQFYLEGQISYAVPREGGALFLWCSTQHPTEMQQVVAHCLRRAAHQVTVEVRRMGGGFGGKESQSALFACVAAVAASRLGRPVKLRPDRDDDMLITGKRHPFEYDFEVGHDAQGRLLAARVGMISQAGHSADLSGPVAARALCHLDNAYYLPAADIQVHSARTHTQSNTAFRGFGGPQGAIAIEYILDGVARSLGLDPLDVRRANFYGEAPRDTTPYGMKVTGNLLGPLVDQLERDSDYRARRAAIRAYNATSPVLRKGLALTPVKFGISFNMLHFNQAGALVHLYTDGSALVNHGGTEMGQGLHTKVAQVVARVLGLPLAAVRATATVTDKVANTSATAASTGADLNGKAAEAAALTLRARLAAVAAPLLGAPADTLVFADGRVSAPGGARMDFAELTRRAYEARVQLWADGFYATPDIHWDRDTLSGRPFYYFAYGASVSEVVVDTLTGEWRLLAADLLHDAGQSLNPALDIGQVEGAYLQGVGWLTSEELRWNADGKLTTHAPSTYKIPAVHDCPPVFRTRLFDQPNREDTIFRSKAVGEPPLLLGFSAFFAIRDALASLADYRVAPPLRAPATPEHILDAADATRAAAGIR